MNRWRRRILVAVALLAIVCAIVFEALTHVGRGWLAGEPFYRGRPASYWAAEIESWTSTDPDWRRTQTYDRRSVAPRWLGGLHPQPQWPGLLDGDRDGLAVLQALSHHPSAEVRDWARIGIERLDNAERGPIKINHPSVILTARLFEVDKALYSKVAEQKWLSLDGWAKLEQISLDGPEKPKAEESLFERVTKEKPLRPAKEINIDDGKEATLLSLTDEVHCLPSPMQRRTGQNQPQKVNVGLVLDVQVQVTSDCRFVRLKLTEKSREVEGIDRVTVVLDPSGKEGPAEIVCVKEATVSIPRTIPDGGTLLLPVQHRPEATRKKNRWLVLELVPRIYILEEEERAIRGDAN
jgi:hypothetical protein